MEYTASGGSIRPQAWAAPHLACRQNKDPILFPQGTRVVQSEHLVQCCHSLGHEMRTPVYIYLSSHLAIMINCKADGRSELIGIYVKVGREGMDESVFSNPIF